MACITADTYRHFGRLGGGAVMGSKNLKAIMIHGDSPFLLPEGKDYVKVFDKVYTDMTDTDMMSKYHNLGTAGNVRVMNDLKALPIRNLQADRRNISHAVERGVRPQDYRNGRMISSMQEYFLRVRSEV